MLFREDKILLVFKIVYNNFKKVKLYKFCFLMIFRLGKIGVIIFSNFLYFRLES